MEDKINTRISCVLFLWCVLAFEKAVNNNNRAFFKENPSQLYTYQPFVQYFWRFIVTKFHKYQSFILDKILLK